MTSGRLRLLVGGTVLLAATAACDGPQSALDPEGPAAERIADVWWWLFALSVPVYLLVLVALGLALFRRRRVNPSRSLTPVVLGGVVLPALVLPPLLLLNFNAMAWFADDAEDPLEVVVTGHLWWWEVDYPALEFHTANEITVPVGHPVRLRLLAEDVIHSLWVPPLAGKMDLIPGQETTLELQADEPGVYRGQCAEYCGIQHAKMGLRVVALEPAEFEVWAAREREPAVAPSTPEQRAGLAAFLENPCAGCHTIRGTPADGELGPDLTHVGSRLTLGAGTIPNTPGHLGGWISNSQTIKPGNLMPPISLRPQELQGLIAYLESLQ